ncbi:MAG: hypothetical protein ACK4J0_00325 [Candidatus Anstonellaceae archaeon]
MKVFNTAEKINCKTCQTNCLSEVYGQVYGSGFSSLPQKVQEKMEELREFFIRINEAVEKKDYALANELKKKALEVYAQFYNLMGQKKDEKMIENLIRVVELMMQRHMEKKAYEFINS